MQRSEHEDQRDRKENHQGVLEEPLKLAKVKLGGAEVDEVAQACENPRNSRVHLIPKIKQNTQANTHKIGDQRDREENHDGVLGEPLNLAKVNLEE
jgi:hypothetical protein